MEAEVSSAEDLEDDFKVVEGETEIVIKEVNTPAIDAAEDLVRITDDKEDIPVNDEEAVSSCASNGSQSSGNRRRANIVVNTSSRRASGGQTCGRSRGGRSSLPPSISQYSSSSEDSSSMKEVVQVRRRKKRKRPLGETERRSRQKSVRIEEALRTGDKDKLSQLAVSDGGLLTDEVRILHEKHHVDEVHHVGEGESMAQTIGDQHVGDGDCSAWGRGTFHPPRVQPR